MRLNMTFIFNSVGITALLSVALLSACSDPESSPTGGVGAAGRDGAAGDAASGAGGEAGEAGGRAGTGNGGAENAGEAGAVAVPTAAGGDAEPIGVGGSAVGGGGAAGTAGAPYDGPLMIPCDVNVIYGVCQNCHSNPTLNEAPFPLVTLDDMQATRLAQVGAVSSGAMPKDGALAPGDKTRLLAWLSEGANGVPQASCR